MKNDDSMDLVIDAAGTRVEGMCFRSWSRKVQASWSEVRCPSSRSSARRGGGRVGA